MLPDHVKTQRQGKIKFSRTAQNVPQVYSVFPLVFLLNALPNRFCVPHVAQNTKVTAVKVSMEI